MVFPGLFDGSLHLDSPLLLLLEELCGFVFGFGHLLVEDLFFLVPEFHELGDLLIDQLLLDLLLSLEPLGLLCLLEMLESISLLGVLLDPLLLLLLLDGDLLLYLEELLVSFLELCSSLGSPFPSLDVSELLSLQLLLDLLLDELSLQLLLLQLLDVVELEVL